MKLCKMLLFIKCVVPQGTWQDSWRAMERLHNDGKIRSLGVSNFDLVDLKELVNIKKVSVSVLQNWFDPFHQDESVRAFCAKHHIHYMGYSTLGLKMNALFLLKVNAL